MQTVLITGGSGLVGSTLTKHLVIKGYRVTVLGRKLPSVRDTDPDAAVRFATWDVNAGTIDEKAVLEAAHIIHLAGAGVMDKKWTKSYKQEIVDSRVKSSALLLDVLKKHPHQVKTFISTSAIGWYTADKDTTQQHMHTEEEPADSSFLGDTCRLWEQSVEPAEALGIRVVKLRTGIVLSREGGALKEFAGSFRFGVGAVMGNGRQVVSWIHIDDLCRMFIAAIENPLLSGSYNAVAPSPVSNRQLVKAIGMARGKFYITLPVPVFMIKLLLGARSIEILKSNTVSCKKIMGSGFVFQYAGIDDAMRSFYRS